MSEALTGRVAPAARGAVIALAVGVTAFALNVVASSADVDDLYLPAMLLGLVAVVLGVRAARRSRRLGWVAAAIGAFPLGATIVYLIVIGLQELF